MVLGFQVGHEGFKGTGAPGVAKAGDHAGHVSAPGSCAANSTSLRCIPASAWMDVRCVMVVVSG